MKDIIKKILQEEKKKLFIPRKIDERKANFEKMVKDANNKFLIDNNIKSLNYTIEYEGELWDHLEYSDIDYAINYESEIILNNGEKLEPRFSNLDLIEYGNTMSIYLSHIISQHNPKDLVIKDLEIEVNSVIDSIRTDFIFIIYKPGGTVYDYQNKKNMRKVVNITKTL
jgi:hypothetical protein